MTSRPDTTQSEFLRITASGEIYLKSRRTRDRFVKVLTENVAAALRNVGIDGTVRRTGYHELRVEAADLERAGATVAGVFGVGRVMRVQPRLFTDLDDLASAVVERSASRVEGKRFAVRIKRRGHHPWRSKEAEALIGGMLAGRAAGVDLDHPEVTVAARVSGNEALLVDEEWSGVHGLPLGTQEHGLALLSGGIDSPVAAWMMMRSGCPIDFLHLTMECSVSDQALAVGHDLASRWAHGHEPSLHVIDFQPVKDAIRDGVDPRYRQVVLKSLMLSTAEQVALRSGVQMVVTGDSLGQVSSQTAAHIVVLDRATEMPIIRPLIALRKDEIMERARRIGTLDLSLRTQEVCDLSDGHRVATRVGRGKLAAEVAAVEQASIDKSMATLYTVRARDWWPGAPFPTL